MTQLIQRKILLGITGGIAAYKAAELTRRLMDVGADVRIVMTEGAQTFITPLTLQALSGNTVHTTLLDTEAEAAMGHIELARWADIIIVAPASANTMARLANGFASDLLSTLCLATDVPIFLAPAMNRLMWSNPATQHNVTTLESRGYTLLGPGVGDQACGEVGAGRMLEPEEIRDALIIAAAADLPTKDLAQESEHSDASCSIPKVLPTHLQAHSESLNDTTIMITAGPTREAIDPVRYLSNRSSGKMGFAVAEAAVLLGAKVVLVAGPVNLSTPAGVERIDVISAKDMHKAVMSRVKETDVFISVAAVADYRVTDVADQKIKKSNEEMTLVLERNPDILADVAKRPGGPFCVGFAAETRDVEHYAQDKLKRKKLDMIAANHVAQADNAVFNSDTNALEVFWPTKGKTKKGHASIGSASKKTVAEHLMALIAVQYRA